LKKLPHSFYLRPTLQVARDLLGKYFVRTLNGKRLVGKIVEVEAYCEGDPASHSYRGRTKRNDAMFWNGGHLYVYFTYGMHFCANVVTGPEGKGEAVLIRGVEPIEGMERMIKNRNPRGTGAEMTGNVENEAKGGNGESGKRRRGDLGNLTNGPAKFCQAFGIGREENGVDLLGDEIYIADGGRISASIISTSTRIGINSGKKRKWRFFVKGNGWLSR